MTKSLNRLQRALAWFEPLPHFLRIPLRSWVVGRTIRFVGSAGIRIEMLTESQAKFQLKNRARVQNHIGSVHAAATALLAETASGLLLGMNLSDDKLPLLKSMQLEYVARARGGLTASAELTSEQRQQIQQATNDEIMISVAVLDAHRVLHANALMCWAWRSKNTVNY